MIPTALQAVASAYVGIMVLLAAAAVGGLERTMGPDMKRFPCVNEATRWILRVHTLSLVWAAVDRLYRVHEGAPLVTTVGQLQASTTMAVAYAALLVMVLRLRLNKGVWPRLQARMRRVRELNALGPEVGATLAKKAAEADPPIHAPVDVPADMLPALGRLAKLP